MHGVCKVLVTSVYVPMGTAKKYILEIDLRNRVGQIVFMDITCG